MGCCCDGDDRSQRFQVDLLGRRVSAGTGLPLDSRVTGDGASDRRSAQRRRRSRDGRLPYGSRPAVKQGLAVKERGYTGIGDDGRAWRYARVEHPVGRADRDVARWLGRVGGVGAPRNGSLFRGVQIPALPASQDVCTLGRFQPEWGMPPPLVGGLPLPFDAVTGAYRFDPEYISSRIDVQRDPAAAKAFAFHGRRWAEEHLMLQPFKLPGSDAWRFRWVPRIQGSACQSAGGNDLSQ